MTSSKKHLISLYPRTDQRIEDARQKSQASSFFLTEKMVSSQATIALAKRPIRQHTDASPVANKASGLRR
jgi:hypothetical protein